MIEVSLGEKIIKVENFLTVEQYQKFRTIKDNPNSTHNDTLAVYLGVNTDELKDAPYEDVRFIENWLTENFDSNLDKKLALTFELDGVEYGLEKDFKNLAWGAWTDLEFLTAKNPTENIHNILAILYRPVIQKNGTQYKIEPYKSSTVMERAEKFKKVSIRVWFGAADFFFLLVTIYTNDIKNSLEWTLKMQNWMKRGLKILPKWMQEKALRGFTSLVTSNSQRMMLQKLNK